MQLHLVDTNAVLVAAWKDEFQQIDDVAVLHANLLAVAENTVVSAANSFGFMDGGIDKALRSRNSK